MVKYSIYYDLFARQVGEYSLFHCLLGITSTDSTTVRKYYSDIRLTTNFHWANAVTQSATSVAINRPIYLYSDKFIINIEPNETLHSERSPITICRAGNHIMPLIPVVITSFKHLRGNGRRHGQLSKKGTTEPIEVPLEMTREEQLVCLSYL